jgi:dTDP-glucose 4,6-dehydratase
MKKFLVTGGCGFIGSNFVRHFLNQYTDIALVNLDKLTYAGLRSNTQEFESDSRYTFVQGDICDAPLVEKLMNGVEAVIHFAAETHVDRSIDSSDDFVRTNVLGTRVLLETAKRANVKLFLHFSTDEVYGSRLTGSFKETDNLDPSSPYSAAKAGSDLLALSYHKTHRVPVVIVRCTNNFGPYQFPEKVIPLFITNLIEGKKVPLYGTGMNVRDWLYVGDCVKAVDFIIHNGTPGEIYNVAGGNEVNNLELTRLILNEFNLGEEMIDYVKDRLAHDFRYSLDASKLAKLGFSIKPNFKTLLSETIRWYQANPSWWKPLKRDAYTVK